jgi:hypothetical protein
MLQNAQEIANQVRHGAGRLDVTWVTRRSKPTMVWSDDVVVILEGV